MRKETVKFRKDGTIKSKSIIESKEMGMLPSYQVEEIMVVWFRPVSRRKKVFSTRII
jgi:hypothetical protein